MFGDNLSFISDTTIAACNGQGCRMKDKFRENFLIAFPAAAVTLVIILIMSFNTEINGLVYNDYNLVQIIPYLLVLIGGIAGFNVFLVLITGIVSGMVIMTFTGQITTYGTYNYILVREYRECLRHAWLLCSYRRCVP